MNIVSTHVPGDGRGGIRGRTLRSFVTGLGFGVSGFDRSSGEFSIQNNDGE